VESVFIEDYNLKLDIDYVDMLNYSLTQNDFSLIKKLRFLITQKRMKLAMLS